MRDPFVGLVARAFTALAPPPRVLVAVSGGADSVALLDALVKGAARRRALAGISFVAGHVDHQLRDGSVADGALVARHAVALDVPFASERVRIEVRGRGLEEAAREARYASLLRLAKGHSCDAIALAHTATDQAETLLLRLARGSGLHGLAGMPVRRPLGDVVLLRPLLDVARDETRAYCGRAGLAFHDDPTNEDDRPRARIRAEVLPVLERLSPGATRHVARTAAILRSDDDALERLASMDSGEPALRHRALIHVVEQALGSRRRLAGSHLAALERLARTGRGEVELPASRTTRRVAVVRAGRVEVEERPRVKKRER